ncbi:MAG TPA: SDR family oxidoreductase [Steroidobacteraceae bacterium]|jgi:NAD(P)-dependent dehydrogenase (short-subunit alcohol dehydrogenase family)|nr:SDR family oxidoreductase [Steroidobacteraceae bacterium]
MLRKLFFVLALALLPLAAQAAFKAGAPTILITGANRGIGLELARQYAAADWNVIATTRRPLDDAGTADLKAIAAKHPQLVIERIDVTDTAMIRGVAQKYKDQPLDVLVNNAAAVETTFQADLEKVNIPYDKIDFDAARTDFDVNTLGPMRMIQAFMPNVEKSKQKKVVNVTSFIGSFGRGGSMAMGLNYGASKAGLNMYTVKLAVAMKPKGVIVALVEPILVASKPGVASNPMSKPVDVEVAKLVKVIDGLTMERTGKITNFSTGEIDPY